MTTLPEPTKLTKDGRNWYAGNDILKKISYDTGIPLDLVKAIANQVFSEIVNILDRGEAVHFGGLGTFFMKKRKSRIRPAMSYNGSIKTYSHHVPGDISDIPKFRMAPSLRKKVMSSSRDRINKKIRKKMQKQDNNI